MPRECFSVSPLQDLTVKVLGDRIWISHTYKESDIPIDHPLDVNAKDIPRLITALRRSYNEWKSSQEQTDADGVVAAILLQSHVATAPGDFS